MKSEGVKHKIARMPGAAYARLLRPLLPRTGPVRYAGLPCCYDRRLFDGIVPAEWVPWQYHDIQGWEARLIEGLTTHVKAGDHVCIVGGGVGTTAVVAAMRASATGRIVCYEGSSTGVSKVRRTVGRNGLSDRVLVVNAVVGKEISVWGSSKGATQLNPADLPECDVLELDCEGSEISILPRLAIRPRTIIVETHGYLGAPTHDVVAILSQLGYQTEVIGEAIPHRSERCRELDIFIVVGHGREQPNGAHIGTLARNRSPEGPKNSL